MKLLFFALLLILVPSRASGSDPELWFSLDGGQSSSNASLGRSRFDLYRIGLQREFERMLLAGDRAQLGGYFEFSLNYWDAADSEILAVAFSPVLALYLGSQERSFRPYVEAGLGASLLSDTMIAGRELSTAFQFEVRFGAGLRSERLDFHIRYMHYSNGSIKQPNPGIDALVVGAAIAF